MALLVGGQAGVDHAADGGQDRRRLGVSLRVDARRSGSRSYCPLLRIALSIAGSLAIESPVLLWVADHRRPTSTGTKKATRTRDLAAVRLPSPVYPRVISPRHRPGQ
jgi:hypothetical protein